MVRKHLQKYIVFCKSPIYKYIFDKYWTKIP